MQSIIEQVGQIVQQDQELQQESLVNYGHILYAELHLRGQEQTEWIGVARANLNVIAGKLGLTGEELRQWCGAYYAKEVLEQ